MIIITWSYSVPTQFLILMAKSNSGKGRERFYAFPRLFADFMEGLRLLCLPQQIIKAGFCSGINFLQVVLASAQHLALILVRPTRCAGFTASQESRPNAGPRQAQAAES